MSARPQFDAFDRELTLAKKLHQAGAFNGATDREKRKRIFRDFVLANGIADDLCGYWQTYAELFRETYQEDL